MLSGHSKPDLEYRNERDSLLVTDSNCYVKCVDCPENEGSYLYYDMIHRVFVKSGKVAGRGFGERGNDHIKGAKEIRPSSTFYRLYLSKHSERARSKRRDHFESLQEVIATGFDPNSTQVDSLDRDYKKGGFFIISTEEDLQIKLSMKNLKCSTKVKFNHMLAYLMELGYNLSLAPGDVVSTNPGFESILSVFRRPGL